jgi:hypothetical protein
MLKVEHRFMIKTLYERGVSISEVARLTGHNRRTVRRVVHGPVSPPRRCSQPVLLVRRVQHFLAPQRLLAREAATAGIVAGLCLTAEAPCARHYGGFGMIQYRFPLYSEYNQDLYVPARGSIMRPHPAARQTCAEAIQTETSEGCAARECRAAISPCYACAT